MEDNELPYDPFQSTQYLDEEPEESPPPNVWGWLSPHNKSMARIDFMKPSIKLGRDQKELGLRNYGSQIVALRGIQISQFSSHFLLRTH